MDKKISALDPATLPLAGTEPLPIVQSGVTVKVSSDDLTVKNIRSNATTGILQVAGPAAGTTRTMTVPNSNFTVVTSTDVIGIANGGTGQTTYTDGQLLIGNSTGNTLTKATLSAGTGISITNGSGSITLATNGQITGGAPVTATNDYTVAASVSYVINNKSGSTQTVTLPAANTNSGRVLTIQNYQAQTVVSASSNVVPLGGGAAGTAILPAIAGSWASIVSDGTNWVMMTYSSNNSLLLE